MLRKILFLLLSLCVGFAALANDAAGILQSRQPATPAAVTECHLSGDAQKMGFHEPSRATSEPSHATLEQAQTTEGVFVFPHGCCAQIAGLVSAPIALLPPFQNEAIAFCPTLRLLSRAADIEHPPRKNA